MVPAVPALDEVQKKVLQEHLLPGETVVWLGAEPRWRYFTRRIPVILVHAGMVLMAGFFTALMLMMNPQIFRGSTQGLAPVLIPLGFFVAVSFSLLRSLFLFARSRPDLYVVTCRRALLISQGVKTRIKSYGPGGLEKMRITRKRNGSGNILFEREAAWVRDEVGRSHHSVVVNGFFGLRSVDEVCTLIKQTTDTEFIQKVEGTPISASGRPAVGGPGPFFGLETSPFHERLYKISIMDGQVCGAKIAGGLSSTGWKHVGEVSGYGFLFAPFASRAERGEQERELRYLGLDPLSSDFLAADRSNFRYGNLEIDHITIHEEHRALDNGYVSCGQMEISLRNGRKRNLWLTRNADPSAVVGVLRSNGVHVQRKEEKPDEIPTRTGV